MIVGDSDMRRMIADALARNAPRGDAVVQAALLKALTDDNLAVRRALAMAMSHIQAPGAADNLVNALAFDDGKDVVMRDGLIRAIENLGKPGIDRLVALGDSGNDRDTDKVVQAFTAFRTRAAADALPTLFKNPHLKPEQKAELLRSYGNYLLDPPVSVEPALTWLLANPKEPTLVKLAGLEALSLGNALKSEKGSAWLLSLLDDADPALRLGVIKGIEDNRLEAAGGKLVKLLADATLPGEGARGSRQGATSDQGGRGQTGAAGDPGRYPAGDAGNVGTARRSLAYAGGARSRRGRRVGAVVPVQRRSGACRRKP